jgi:curli biogenesis system outer membrane secretion channel CsgG
MNSEIPMKLRSLLLSFVVCLIPSTALCEKPAEYMDTQARAAFGQLAPQAHGQKVFIAPFIQHSYGDEEEKYTYDCSANTGERYFESALREQFVLSGKFRVVARSKLDKALEELKLQRSDLFDADSVKAIGKFVGADTIVVIEGEIREQGMSTSSRARYYHGPGFNDFFDVKVYYISIETGEIQGFWKRRSGDPQ